MALTFSENIQRNIGLSVTSNPKTVLSSVGLQEETQAAAEAGTATGRYMSARRTKQAIDAQVFPGGIVLPSKGGTGVANNNASTITISGSFGTTFTITAATSVTLPTSGTLATLAGSEALTNKTYNGNTWTAGTGILTLGAGKTATISNTLTFTGTDASSVAFGTGGTVAYTANKLSVFAATTSAELAGVISDETGAGALVFGTSPGFTTAANPASSDGAALGTTALMWSDLFLASGAVINFNNGDVTLTHLANQLDFQGASTGYFFDAIVGPKTSDGAPLGSAGNMWSDLFLASGAVVNFNNGDVTITHAADTLTYAGATSYAFDAQIAITMTAAGATPVKLISTAADAIAGPILDFDRNSASPTTNDTIGGFQMHGRSTTGATVLYGQLLTTITDATNASEDARFDIYAIIAGVQTLCMAVGAGVQIGSPTGGDKGIGSINAAADIYKNNTAYTNPDYVLEHFYSGGISRFAHKDGARDYRGLMSLDDLRNYTRENFRLPGISDEPMGMFERGDKALEKIEELTLYILELHERIARLEKEIKK